MEPTVGGHSEGAPWTLWGTLGGNTVDTLEGHQGEQPWTLGEGSWTLWWTLCGSTGGSIRQTVNGKSVN